MKTSTVGYSFGINGARGLENHGVYQPPDSFDLLTVFPEQYEEESRAFVRRLLSKLNEYDANATSLDQEAYSLGSDNLKWPKRASKPR